MKVPKSNTPRWIVFLLDLFVCFFSIVLAYLLRFNFEIPEQYFKTLGFSVALVVGIRAISFLVAKTYAGIIRYTSTKDAERIFLTVLVGTVIFFLVNLFTYSFGNKKFLIPTSILIIEFLSTVFMLIAIRIMIKIAYFEIKNPSRSKRNVVIYGAGEAGLIAKRTMDRDAGSSYKTFAFIDDDDKKAGKKLEGIAIFHSSELNKVLEENQISQTIVSVQNLSSKKLKKIADICLKHNVKLLNVPPASKWINGELSFRQIKTVKIEDLLGREEINLDKGLIRKQLGGKVVLVTGAAGSIGSGLVREIVKYEPSKVIMLDQAESFLYELNFELSEKQIAQSCEVVVADICSKPRMENVFKTFKPDLVYHAAAYKHVPLMEDNPSESVNTNVLGTKIVADLALEYNTERFVMVSTDKAVNPSNVMGATKRIAEIYTQSLNEVSKTDFITTRFGNVLGSNGSVIPLFKKQIDQGGPVTVTHPDITRYFMTIPEACQLVLEAGAIGKGGQIYIFDMGESVKIINLAKRMIKLSGLELGKDIQIVFTGLRPGEKLYEELLNDKENTLPTHHPQIMIAKVDKYNLENVGEKIEKFNELVAGQDNLQIVRVMKDLVPEFKSENSIYQSLDSK